MHHEASAGAASRPFAPSLHCGPQCGWKEIPSVVALQMLAVARPCRLRSTWISRVVGHHAVWAQGLSICLALRVVLDAAQHRPFFRWSQALRRSRHCQSQRSTRGFYNLFVGRVAHLSHVVATSKKFSQQLFTITLERRRCKRGRT